MGLKLRVDVRSVVLLLPVAVFAASSSDARLAEAVKDKDQQAVHSLLKQHIDVNARLDYGATALAWAAHWDDVQTADLLIHAGANVNLADELGATPLSLACSNGNPAAGRDAVEGRRGSEDGHADRRNNADDLRPRRQSGCRENAPGARG